MNILAVTTVKHDSEQCVTVPKILNDTNTFLRYQIFLIPIPVLFSVPNTFDTDTGTFSVPNIFDTDTGTFFGTKFFRYFFRYQIWTIPVLRLFSGTKFFRYQIWTILAPRLFSDTKFFRYWFRYHQKKIEIPGTGTYTIPVPITLISSFAQC